ncbi:Pre-mRNA-splicing factor [Dirofilaria immitis]
MVQGTLLGISSTLITTTVFRSVALRSDATDFLKDISADSIPGIYYHPSSKQERINENKISARGLFTINTKIDKIIMYSVIGAMLLTAAVNLGRRDADRTVR